MNHASVYPKLFFIYSCGDRMCSMVEFWRSVIVMKLYLWSLLRYLAVCEQGVLWCVFPCEFNWGLFYGELFISGIYEFFKITF
jgi:hypothetical protein